MKICSKKDVKVIAGTMAAALLLGGCSTVIKKDRPAKLKSDPNAKTEIDLRKVPDTFYDEEVLNQLYRNYSINLFGQTVNGCGDTANVMISPASIMMALDMVAAGGKGETLRQMTDLFAEGQNPLKQQAYAADLMKKINSAGEVDFTCANAIWANKDIIGDTVNLEYVDYVRNTFQSEYRTNVFNDKTVKEINGWISKNTNNMINDVISDLQPRTAMVLVNAICFEGKWENPYEGNAVGEGCFYKKDGTTQNVTFLSGGESNYFSTDKATGFMKRYEGGQYAFLTILPNDTSVSANEFAKNFTAEDYEKFIGSVTYQYDVITKMPEFTSDFDKEMNGPLKDLGVTDVFNERTSDLSGIAGVPGDLYVGQVLHKTHIEVDAEGTKAAAVTVITGIACDSIEEVEIREVICDRPYMYAIVDVSSMAPIFIGTVNEV